jgi:hypothetical protein
VGQAHNRRILTLAKDTAEDGRAQSTVLVEDLVDDVPGIDFALVARSDCGDMVLDDRGKSTRITDVGYPGRELGMPDN